MKKLKYCIKGKDTFIEFAESPAGTYYLNVEKRLVIFIASGNMSNEEAYEIDGFMATVGMASRIENASKIKFIHNNFIRLDVDKDWDPETPITYEINGELELAVSGKPGNLYVDPENKRWYFESTIKGLRDKLLDIFKENIMRDAEAEPKIRSIVIVLETWKEIEEDAIISN